MGYGATQGAKTWLVNTFWMSHTMPSGRPKGHESEAPCIGSHFLGIRWACDTAMQRPVAALQ